MLFIAYLSAYKPGPQPRSSLSKSFKAIKKATDLLYSFLKKMACVWSVK